MSESQSNPNILFLFTDQQRPDYIGTQDSVPVRTPNIDKLAERGIEFTNAVCPSPVCNPSRACIASGNEYDRCGVPANNVDYPLNQTTLYQRLRDEGGYHVMGCGKFDLQTYFTLGLSGDNGVERYGFSEALFNPAKNNTVRRFDDDINAEPRDPYTKYLDEHELLEAHAKDINQRWKDGMWTATYPTPLPDHAYYDNWITRNALDLIDGAPKSKPWFLEVDFQNPHHPWDVTEEMYEWYREPDVEFPNPVNSDLDISTEKHQEIRRNYAAMVEHIDQCVGRLIEKLKERGELENTLIIFTSDHGEMLGDHSQWQKLSPLQMSVGVPLVVAGPDVTSRQVTNVPATILDLHSTILDYANVELNPDVDSITMRPVFKGDDNQARDVVYSGLSSWRMVYDGRYKLIVGYNPELRYESVYEPMNAAPENTERRQRERDRILHDLEHNETDNLASSEPEVVDRLTTDLQRMQHVKGVQGHRV
jgi:choline-sulfatase